MKIRQNMSFHAWAAEIQSSTRERAREIVEAATDEGAIAMRTYIETRGTPNSGKEGRIDTGRMLDAVGTEVSEGGGNAVVGAFGWVGDRAEYFLFQEEGTSRIPAMLALQDAFDDAVAIAEQEATR